MTKIPWRGKEPKSSHKVFTATKPGETVSVDQIRLIFSKPDIEIPGGSEQKNWTDRAFEIVRERWIRKDSRRLNLSENG